MIGSDLESRVPSWTTSDDAAAVRAVIEGRSRSALPARRDQRVSASCSF